MSAAQSHLAALEIASSSDTTSDLSVRAGSVDPPDASVRN